MPRTLELLAPARDADTAIAAINHGADAVYMGAPAFGARAAASNSLDDVRRVADYAHIFGVRLYITLNTIIYENELSQITQLVADLYRMGVDAIIVQDMALLSPTLPPIQLHASTQTDARSAAKVALLAQAGFSQIVVPREFSLEEIREAAAAAARHGSDIEVFVHGALCVSYSGDCHAGVLLTGRSANRGECPQICRLQFNLTDSKGTPIASLPDGGPATRHWLSLADMNRLAHLTQLAEAGASSFKIEGRLKNISYVKNVTAAYSRALDQVVAESGGRYVRASYGRSRHNFAPDVSRSFNRGFTSYFLTPGDSAERHITSWQSPKWTGKQVAVVKRVKGNTLQVNASEEIHNGDGLGYFDSQGRFQGFRINRAEGAMLYPAPGTILPPAGTILYRNSDTAREALMSRDDTAERRIDVDMTLRHLTDGRLALDLRDERGNSVSVTSTEVYNDTARTPQETQRLGILQRLGDTVYSLASLNDLAGDTFIPSKSLTALRRSGIEALDRAWRIHRPIARRKASTLSADALKELSTTYHDNVANSLAAEFYTSHGATVGQRAAEVDKPQGRVRIMTTRYCLRRSLGACLRTPQGRNLPPDLYLDAPVGRLRLDFDCKNCNMQVSCES